MTRAKLMWAALACAFTLGYGVVCVRHGAWDYDKAARQKGALNAEKQGTDFTAYYSAGELARSGKSIYDWRASSTPRRPYIYPPLFALFPMLPIALLSHDAALGVFYALNALVLAAALWMLRRMLWPAKQSGDSSPFYRSAAVGALLTLAVCWRFIHANTIVGNANLLILFLIVLALFQEWKASRTHEICSGAAIALATAFKVTPGLFGLFFLWSWRRWAMLGGALGLLACFFLLPAMWFGWDQNLKYLRAFAHNAAGKASGSAEDSSAGSDGIVIGWGTPPDGVKREPLNESGEQLSTAGGLLPAGEGSSLRGALTNLLTHSSALKVRAGTQTGIQNRTVNLLSLSAAQARFAADLCSIALLLLTAALTFRSARVRDGRRLALVWSLITVTMVLIAPLTRIAHLVVLVLPVATLVALLQHELLKRREKILAWSALLFLSAGCALVSGFARSSRFFETLQAMGFTTLALMLLYVAIAAALLTPATWHSRPA